MFLYSHRHSLLIAVSILIFVVEIDSKFYWTSNRPHSTLEPGNPLPNHESFNRTQRLQFDCRPGPVTSMKIMNSWDKKQMISKTIVTIYWNFPHPLVELIANKWFASTHQLAFNPRKEISYFLSSPVHYQVDANSGLPQSSNKKSTSTWFGTEHVNKIPIHVVLAIIHKWRD